MGTFFKIAGFLIAIAAATVLSSLAAAAGVGMVNSYGCDPMGLAVLIPLCYGLFWGFPVSVVTAIAVCAMTPKYSHRFAGMLFIPPLIIFAGFAVVFGIDDRARRQEEKACQKIISTCEKDPAALHALITRIQTGALSGTERAALNKIIESPTAVQAEDIPVLIRYSKGDGACFHHVIGKITSLEQLRKLYESNKNPPQHTVLLALLDNPVTPPDILQEMTRSPDPQFVARVRERIAKDEKKAACQRILSDGRKDPRVLHELIARISAGNLSQLEHETLCRVVESPETTILETDIPALLNYLEKKSEYPVFHRAIEKISTPGQLRDLYRRENSKYSPDLDVFYDLAVHPLTPMDILTAISKLPDLWFADKLRDRIASDQKKAAN